MSLDLICDRATIDALNSLIKSDEVDLTLELHFLEMGKSIAFGTSSLDLSIMRDESRPIRMQVLFDFYYQLCYCK